MNSRSAIMQSGPERQVFDLGSTRPRTSCRMRNHGLPDTFLYGYGEVTMTATNELEALLCQEELPDEFCRLSSSSPQRDKPSVAFMLSGIIPVCHQDEVTCPLMVRRHLMVPAWQNAFAAPTSHYA